MVAVCVCRLLGFVAFLFGDCVTFSLKSNLVLDDALEFGPNLQFIWNKSALVLSAMACRKREHRDQANPMMGALEHDCQPNCQIQFETQGQSSRNPVQRHPVLL